MKNIHVAYILSFLWRSWFWLGVWVFYYLRFTDYAGIGFLEAVMITTSSLGEIPTGAIADIVGKKKAVNIAFAMSALGNFIMAFAPNYYVLLLSIITMTLGGCFYSGSLEALVYDSLKESKNESMFDKVIARMTSLQNLGLAVSGIVGGYLYSINVSLPFIGVGLAYVIGFFYSFKLSEPSIDTQKYSWQIFVDQNVSGFKQLFSNVNVKYMVLALIIPSSFMVATENVLNDATAIEIGFNSIQLGIFATVLYLVGIFVSEKSTLIMKIFSGKTLYYLLITLYLITLLSAPWLGFWTGAVILLLRYSSQTVFSNFETVRLNKIIDSKYRATTLSTYSLLRNLPYVFGATGIGLMMNILTAQRFSAWFGLLLIATLVTYLGATKLIAKR